MTDEALTVDQANALLFAVNSRKSMEEIEPEEMVPFILYKLPKNKEDYDN
jgi:hypothetical protein